MGFRPLTMDLYIPARPAARPVPVVVYAHPGGFFAGIEQMGPWRFLLEAGLAVVSVQYRLSGEAVFPAAVQDVATAVRWVRVNADRYGLDAERIVGFGSSAGAYLISAVALAGDSSELVGGIEPYAKVSRRLAGVVEHYAPTDFLRHDQDAHLIAGGDHGSPHFNAAPLQQTTLEFLASVLVLPLHP
jgi:acetyl esterase/lipase